MSLFTRLYKGITAIYEVVCQCLEACSATEEQATALSNHTPLVYTLLAFT